MIDIDWSKAPEWSTAYARLENKNWYYYINDKCYAFYTNLDEVYEYGSSDESTEYFVKGEFEILEERPRPQPKPVYTQAMCDNGELPSVGMKIKLQYNQTSQPIECELLFISEQYMIVKEGSLEQHYHRDTWHPEPIDTRTDKEKAVDEIIFGDTGTNTRELLSIVYDKWVGES